MTNAPSPSPLYRSRNRKILSFDRIFPSISFYLRFLSIVFRASSLSNRNLYGNVQWYQSSLEILRALERVGVNFEISGLEHIRDLDTSCVVVANHMSVLETTILPMILLPYKKITFIVKDSLMKYPVFKNILHSREPIVVSRTNAREDLKTVIKEGTERLLKGISVVVFPQTTRTRYFDPQKFNTIGVKLAGRANLPAVPLALLTDAWGNGKWIKEFGKIHTGRTVRFAFGAPLWVQGRGTDVHRKIIAFIDQNLNQWRAGRTRGTPLSESVASHAHGSTS